MGKNEKKKGRMKNSKRKEEERVRIKTERRDKKQ